LVESSLASPGAAGNWNFPVISVSTLIAAIKFCRLHSDLGLFDYSAQSVSNLDFKVVMQFTYLVQGFGS